MDKLFRVEFDSSTKGLSGTCSIFFDNFQIYMFNYVELEEALVRCSITVRDLKTRNIYVPFFTRALVDKNIIGRKIYYRDTEAVIEEFEAELGRLRIRADNRTKQFPQPLGQDPDENLDRFRERVDILSPLIHWYREPEEQ